MERSEVPRRRHDWERNSANGACQGWGLYFLRRHSKSAIYSVVTTGCIRACNALHACEMSSSVTSFPSHVLRFFPTVPTVSEALDRHSRPALQERGTAHNPCSYRRCSGALLKQFLFRRQ
ncbi:hypothetical protein NDU88_003730 [Pleurodeles waltl]|uniref:Uncharacterized protein n=1 Tax=Pleurodeles waltl TaxID=8319 RepID=A0AAV7NHH1_PLEWA|nr:hypothetical protein NDU88_003730 [Pleurodeles waltl]